MAFAGAWVDDKLIKIGSDGWVGLHESTPNYRAWKAWLQSEFRRQYFPKWITVLGEWPPATRAGADAYAVALSEIRDSKYQKEQVNIGGLPVPRHPSPWDGRVPPAPKTDDEGAFHQPPRPALTMVK